MSFSGHGHTMVVMPTLWDTLATKWDVLRPSQLGWFLRILAEMGEEVVVKNRGKELGKCQRCLDGALCSAF